MCCVEQHHFPILWRAVLLINIHCWCFLVGSFFPYWRDIPHDATALRKPCSNLQLEDNCLAVDRIAVQIQRRKRRSRDWRRATLPVDRLVWGDCLPWPMVPGHGLKAYDAATLLKLSWISLVTVRMGRCLGTLCKPPCVSGKESVFARKYDNLINEIK